jgi:cobalt/nickel transport system permease protein
VHHLVVERWSSGATWLHRRDPRAKMIALLALLVTLATARRGLPELCAVLIALLCLTLASARIPLKGALLRSLIALAFAGVFAVACWLGGDSARAVAVLLKGYVSALAALTLVATTPLPALLRGLERMRAPALLVTVAQFVYRYLFVISEEAQHMSKAAASRGAAGGAFSVTRFRAASGALAVLFARSYSRASDVHRAMLARGFNEGLPVLAPLRFGVRDALFTAAASLTPVAARIGLERFL